MASSSSRNNDIPLSTLLQWYKIRDTLFGHNFVRQNIPLAIELASTSQHPDARWLTKACAGKDVRTKEDAKRALEMAAFCNHPDATWLRSSLCKVGSTLKEVRGALHALALQEDERALCFLWLLEEGPIEGLRRSAELGYAWAQVLMFQENMSDDVGFLQLALAQSYLFFLFLFFRSSSSSSQMSGTRFVCLAFTTSKKTNQELRKNFWFVRLNCSMCIHRKCRRVCWMSQM